MNQSGIDESLDDAVQRLKTSRDEFAYLSEPQDAFFHTETEAYEAALQIIARATARGLRAEPAPGVNGVSGGSQDGVPGFFPLVRLLKGE